MWLVGKTWLFKKQWISNWNNELLSNKKIKNITCLMIGKNIDNKNKQLKSIIKYKLDKYVFLLDKLKIYIKFIMY